MGYFADNYNSIRYPIAENDQPGLRRAQIGAIHSISSYLTVGKQPGIVIMPTGTGKTAVLMMCPFVLRANRVLVITPSKLVRNQIALGFSELQPLQRLGVIRNVSGRLRVHELKHEVRSMAGWAELSNYSVVVSTPKCISPGVEGIEPSDPEFFDLVLIDEAHHTPANSWIDIITHYEKASKVLFTATPFRRDKKEIPGKIIYNYPVSLAYEEGIFGKTEFIAVNALPGDDLAIARECERIFRSEPEGTVHYVMVRTDSKVRANELAELYRDNTNLRLSLVHSGLAARAVESTINNLRNGSIDGIFCVDMLGEGFDFPNLKIAAIHSPHKSLAATLQFIGRFTRTNADNVTYAKFIAIPEEIEIERKFLYRENAIWRELIIDLSEARIDTEVASRDLIDGFQINQGETSEEFQELSLNSIEPSYHVKIYSINRGVFQCEREIDFSIHGLEIAHREDNPDENISLLILQDIRFPKWSKSNALQNVTNHLIVTYFDEESNLLFVNSTLKKSIEFYEFILNSYFDDVTGSILSDSELNSVLSNIDEAEFFNIGLRNRSHYGANESYRIITGSTAHMSIDRRDAEFFHRGHLFGKGVENGSNITIGLSSSSKVWSQQNGTLFQFVKWAKAIAQKINEELDGRTNTPVDDLPISRELDALPDKVVVSANWHEIAYKNFTRVTFQNGGVSNIFELTDIQLVFDHENSDDQHYRIQLICNYFTLPIFFSFNYDTYFTSENEHLSNKVTVYRTDSDNGIGLMDFINSYPLMFYFEDFSLLYNCNQFLDAPRDVSTFPLEYLNDSINWSANGVDIDNELTGPRSIHEYLKTSIAQMALPFAYYDHGPGETADFITGELTVDEILIKFYHCKGSSTPVAGNRVGDVYEVIGQGIKSLNFTYLPRLILKLEKRQQNKVLSGNCSDSALLLKQLSDNNRGIKVAFQIILVQPGITKNGIEPRILGLLSAANSNISGTNNCKNLEVICSI